jgi:hypothetical protein
MSEKNLIVNGLTYHYKGIFNMESFLLAYKKSVEVRGYRRHEKRFEELVKENGKDMFLEFRPTKIKTDYIGLMIKIRVEMKDVNDIMIEIDGVPTQFQEGDITLTFDAWVTTRYAQRWNMNPVFWFIRAVFNKYVYQFPLESGSAGEVAGDCHYVFRQIKAHLNLYKYKVTAEA